MALFTYHDRCENTVLHRSILKDPLFIFQKKVQFTRDINSPDCKGFSPLHIAVLHNKQQHASFLLRRGADPNFFEDFTYIKTEKLSPFQYSIMLKRNTITEMMIHRGANLYAVDTFGFTPLGLAIRYGNDEAVFFFLQHGFNPNEVVEYLPEKEMYIYDILRKEKHTELVNRLLREYKDVFSRSIQKKLSEIRLNWLLKG